jgi:hypothetical protein
MKTQLKKKFMQRQSGCRGQKEGGFVATVLFLGLLVIMLMLATAGSMALTHLHDEVKVLQRQQIKRLNLSVTNSVANSHVIIPKANAK